MRHLKGYTTKEMYEFKGESLSTALSECALFCAGIEAKSTPEFHLDQQYDTEDGCYIVFLFHLES